MAGRNQHYIPQFFQRGFGAPAGGKPKEIWVFRKGQAPELAEIKRSATGFDFYSPPTSDGSPTLDDTITDQETPLARRVAEVRAMPVGQSVDTNVAADIVAHLAPRTSHIRAALEHGINGLLTGAIAAFTNSENVERMLGLNANAPSDRFRQQLRKIVEEDARFEQIGLPKPVLERVAFQLAKENFSHLFKAYLPEVGFTLDRVMSNAESMVRDGHNKALSSAVDKDVRRELLENFIWSIEAAPLA